MMMMMMMMVVDPHMQNFAFVKAAFIPRIGRFRVEIPKRDIGYSVCCPSNLPQTLEAKP
jgi:hypothetical protein